MAIRVVHCGTGLTGREALRAIIEDPALELVGQYVSTPEKIGKDAGDLCGLPPTGVLATGDLDEVVALGADCLCYAGDAVGREHEACDEMAKFLRAGTNVVTFAVVEICHPPASPPELRSIIESACAEGGTSLYASGTEPGAMSMNVPAAMLSMAGEVTGYREQQFAIGLASAYPLEHVLRESMGFGKPDGSAPSRIVDGTVETRWTSDIVFIADLLGVTLDGIKLEWETACTPHDIVTEKVGTYEAGTICAYWWQLFGVVGDRQAVTIEYIASITKDAFVPSHWPRLPEGVDGAVALIIEGRPGYRALLMSDPMPGEALHASIPMTALAATNAIPAVVAAGPGHLAATDLPYYATRRARFDA
jgi:2,4-diaminopentanoate dehydrogenase